MYVLLTGELTLGAPIERACAYVCDYPSWQSYLSVEHISGEARREGELVRLRSSDVQFPPYYARTIRMEPERRLIWKTLFDSILQRLTSLVQSGN